MLNIFPSIDIPVFAPHQYVSLTQLATGIDNTVVLCISADLPFAQSRFCRGAEGLNNVIPLSTFRNAEFLQKLTGVAMLMAH